MLKQIISIMCLTLFLTPLKALSYRVDIVDQFPEYQGENGFYPQGGISNTTGYHNQYYVLDELDTISGNQYDFGKLLHSGNDYLPRVAKDTTTKEIFMNPIYLSSPSVSEYAVLMWEVPDDMAGSYNISGQFRVKENLPGSNGVEVYILKNDNWSTPLYKYEGVLLTNQIAVFNITASLSATDNLRFIVGHNGDSNWDHTMLKGDITLVPLPGAVWLLGSGLLGLGAVGWRQRKKI